MNVLEKIAISDELKRKAALERNSRQTVVDKSVNNFREAYLNAGKVKQFDEKKIRAAAKNVIGLKGPKPLYNIKNPIHDPKGYKSKLNKRVDQLESYSKNKNTLSSHIKKVKTVKALKNVAPKALIGAGILGAAYGGKKLYDHYTNKEASVLEKVALSDELKYRAFIERGARNAAIDPMAHSIAKSEGLGNIRAGDSFMNKMMPQRANSIVQQAAPRTGPNPFSGAKFDQMHAMSPNSNQLMINRATEIRQNALAGKNVTPYRSSLQGFLQSKTPPVAAKPVSTASKIMSSPLTKKIGIGAGLLGAGALAGGYLMNRNQPQPIQKVAFSPAAVAGLELGGLGILAKPGIDTLRDPNASAHDKSHAKWETAGLGVLGIHPAYELAQAAKPHISNVLSKVKPAISSAAGNVIGEGAGLASNLYNKAQPLLSKIKFH